MTSAGDFEYEVFISYAHLDNKPLPGEEKGWVSYFDELLDNLLGEYLGSEARIWRDNMLRGDDVVPDTIRIQFPRIAVMVSILSPRYIKSPWCLWEVNEFCEKAQSTGGFRIGNKSRVYKVIKTPIRSGEPPVIFKDLKGYQFFQDKDRDERPKQFGLEYGAEAKKNFLDRVGDLAYDITNLLEIIRTRPDSRGVAADDNAFPTLNVNPSSDVAIYLAEPTPDLDLEHANIRRDLLQRNYRVLPEQPLPAKADEFIDTVRAGLAESSVSVHLIGEQYGDCPEGDNRSYVYLQNMLAVEREHDPNFCRLIWIPKEKKPVEVRQRGFVKELLNSTGGRTDLLQTTLEDFKTAVQDRIKAVTEAPSKNGHQRSLESSARTVYIVCDKLDAETVKPLDAYLLSAGYETYFPITSGDEAIIRRNHEEKLLSCDAVLVYWGSAPKLWLLTKLYDLLKVRGYGRDKPILSEGVFITGPLTPEKERFRARDVLVMKNFAEISPEGLERSLQPFTSEIEQQEGNVRENS